MYYTETGPRSAEILRLALPSISKHGGNYVPTSYAVWYEYLAGTNAKLSSDLKHKLEESDVLDQDAIADLYAEHILSRDMRNNRLLEKSLEAMLRQLETSAEKTSGSTEKYERSLEDTQVELETLTDTAGLQVLLRK